MTQPTDTSPRALGGVHEEKLLTTFFVLFKNARIVEATNRAYIKQCGHFFDLLQPGLNEAGEVSIKTADGRYFANEKFVPFTDSSGAGKAVLEEWEKLGIGGVRFTGEVRAKDIEKFFAVMIDLKPVDGDLKQLQDQLDAHVPSTIELLAKWEPEEEEDLDDEERRRQLRTMARTNFFRAISTVQDIMANTAAERDVNLAKTRRVVHSLIDHISRDEDSMLELAAIKDFDDYTYAHSINVSVYALTIGVRVGLDRPRLSRLGFAALFHDIGKVRLPHDLINKPDAFDETDWAQMQKHPLLGAKTILRNMRLDPYSARAARGAFEHHINADFTGYPTLRYKQEQSNLFSRIIAIADTFDALTSGRIYLKKAIPPDRVIKKMLHQMHQKFDPFLLKIFSNIVGIFPPGTLVLLNTDEIGVVLSSNAAERDRPVVQIIGDRNGLLDGIVWADLAQSEHRHRSIVRMIEAERYGIKVRDFVLSD